MHLYKQPVAPDLRSALLLAGALVLTGCATTGPVPVLVPETAGPRVTQCAQAFARLEQAVAAYDVRDNQAEVIEGFPYLRVNRFLASFRNQVHGAALQRWLDLLARLDATARPHELANLPASAREALGAAVQDRLRRCRQRLLDWDTAHPQRIALIRERATVPDGYLTWRRALGLYPVTGWFILQGVEDWHDEVEATFADGPPEYSDAVVYVPATDAGLSPRAVAAILHESARNPLHVPRPDAAQRRALAQTFAPIITLPVTGDYDRIGVPVWTTEGKVTVRPEPVAYVLFSHTRLGDASLLQINYTVWFAARPRTGPLDLLGGRLDGLVWRVTLGAGGEPLLYDAMHPCGCYHMAFPGKRLAPKAPPEGLQEALLVPRHAPAGTDRMTLYLQPRTHYLVGLSRDTPEGRRLAYHFADYAGLRSLPIAASGQRSLFGDFGIVPGTERRERWVLWPTGVRAPGAMRQWGRHLTAFVGKRHFDDPYLIQRYFTVTGTPAP